MLRTTVIAKCDLAHSTERMHQLTTTQLGNLLTNQTQRIMKVVADHAGSILKGEGDAFWMTFPSVTAAALAAKDMLRTLRQAQIGQPESERLAMRVAIALGDVLHREGDLFGTVMALTARIEGITPADEIYMAQAAWLALNHAQVQTTLIDTFQLKGFDQPEAVYRVIQQENIAIENQVIVMTDLRGFTPFIATHGPQDIAQVLTQYEALTLEHITPLGGRLRALAGDTNFSTFDSAMMALTAIYTLTDAWNIFVTQMGFPLSLLVGIHRGEYYIFRGYMFGEAIHIASGLVDIRRADSSNLIYVSGAVRDELEGTHFAERLQVVPTDHLPERKRDLLTRNRIYALRAGEDETAS